LFVRARRERGRHAVALIAAARLFNVLHTSNTAPHITAAISVGDLTPPHVERECGLGWPGAQPSDAKAAAVAERRVAAAPCTPRLPQLHHDPSASVANI
jgi:hypothetical protein